MARHEYRDIWADGEADMWFERNDAAASESNLSERADISDLLRFLELTELPTSELLEVGCSSGRVLETISGITGAHGVGIDLSAKAVAAGIARLESNGSNCELQVGSATDLPFKDSEFDLVMAGFFLYAVPPNQLFKTLSELDRVLRPGGFLTIRDFQHPHFISVPYGHQKDSKVFKRNYIEMLVSTRHYSIAFFRSFSEIGQGFSDNPDLRESFTILYKEPKPYLTLG